MPIIAEGEFTFQDVLAACRLISRQAKWRSWFSIGFAGLLFLAAVFYGIATTDFSYLFLPLFLGLLFVCTRLFVPWLTARKIYKTSQLGGVHRFEIDDQGFKSESPLSKGYFEWKVLFKWCEGKHTFLLYPNATFAQFLPKSFFSQPADVEVLRVILQKNVRPH